MRILTWNLEWKSPKGRGPANDSIRAELTSQGADLVCLTEAHSGWLGGGYEATSLPAKAGSARRKVVIWSRWPLVDIDRGGPPQVADLHRWCAATTVTPGGPVRLIGVVIPYAQSNVTHGSGRARPWEDHERYLDALAETLEVRDRTLPTVVFGDFNQRLDGAGGYAPAALRTRLNEVLEDFTIVTRKLTPSTGRLLDHIAVDAWEAKATGLIERESGGTRRSDHHGSWIAI